MDFAGSLQSLRGYVHSTRTHIAMQASLDERLWADHPLAMSFMDHIRACNAHDPAAFRPFEVEDTVIGHVLTAFMGRLAAFPDIFQVEDDRVILRPVFRTPEERTKAMRRATLALQKAGVLPPDHGEDYAIVKAWGQPTLFLLDRAHVSAFGLKAFGLHVNGFVRSPEGLKLWIGTRSLDKAVAPGKLDNMVAGGQPAGLTLAQNLLKEAAEEADIPADLAATAIPVGALSYRMGGRLGLKPDTMFLYDLELPADFVPRNTDGEISSFALVPLEEVAERVRSSSDFKFNVNLVIIDFLIRHGYLSPDLEPDYLGLVSGLRRG
jgi:8-oxo-dGTP pyrophosphatase MutT (NUDIX family)